MADIAVADTANNANGPVPMETTIDSATDLTRPPNAPATFMLGRRPVVNELAVKQQYLGEMCHICRHCRAKHFMHEKHTGQTSTNAASFSLCCMQGAVQLPSLKPTPQRLGDLLAKRRPKGAKLLKDIRSYNGAFQMASSGDVAS